MKTTSSKASEDHIYALLSKALCGTVNVLTTCTPENSPWKTPLTDLEVAVRCLGRAADTIENTMEVLCLLEIKEKDEKIPELVVVRNAWSILNNLHTADECLRLHKASPNSDVWEYPPLSRILSETVAAMQAAVMLLCGIRSTEDPAYRDLYGMLSGKYIDKDTYRYICMDYEKPLAENMRSLREYWKTRSTDPAEMLQ